MLRADSEIRTKMESGFVAPRLDGWKDIATHLGKSERTVKRWEADRGLPIHRVPGGGGASVYAHAGELDEWLRSSKASEGESPEFPEAAKHSAEPAPYPAAAAAPALADLAFQPVVEAADEPARSSWLARRRPWVLALSASLPIGLLLLAAVLRTGSASPSARSTPFSRRIEPASEPRRTLAVSDAERNLAGELCLKGRYEWNQRTPESLNRALDLFTQAIVHDPEYAKAYAGLADTYDLLWEYTTMPEGDALPRAITAARKAVELDNSLAEAHRSLAFAERYGSWDFLDAEKEFRRAIELNPNDAQARRWYANAYAVPGRFDEALDQLNKAQELDPSSHATLADKGMLLAEAGRTDEAIEMLREVERSAPEFRSPHVYLMRIGLDLHDYTTFLSEGDKTAEVMNDAVLKDIMAAARAAYARDGERGLLRGLYARQKEYYNAGKFRGTMLAVTCVLMGKKQEALQLLEEAYQRREPEMLGCLSHPDLLRLKDEPRYKALLKKINFPAPSPDSPPKLIAGIEASRQ